MPLFLVGLHCYTQDIEVLSATCQQKNAAVTIMSTVLDALNGLLESLSRSDYPRDRLVVGGVAMLDISGFDYGVAPLFSRQRFTVNLRPCKVLS